MAFKLICKCGKEFITFQKQPGETLVCKKCGTEIVIPDLSNLREEEIIDAATGQYKIQLHEADHRHDAGHKVAAHDIIDPKDARAPGKKRQEDDEEEIDGPPVVQRKRIKPVLSWPLVRAFMVFVMVIAALCLLVYFFPTIVKLVAKFIKDIRA